MRFFSFEESPSRSKEEIGMAHKEVEERERRAKEKGQGKGEKDNKKIQREVERARGCTHVTHGRREGSTATSGERARAGEGGGGEKASTR